jgi:hypothetical protein
VGLAEGATLFGKEALSFQVLFARLKIIQNQTIFQLNIMRVLTVQLKHWLWKLLLSASTQRSPASIGKPQAKHLVVNNSFQSKKNDVNHY